MSTRASTKAGIAALAIVTILLLGAETAAVSYGSLGTKVQPGNPDFVPTLTYTLAGVTDAYLARRDIGIAADHADDAYYIHFGAAADTALTTAGRTFRLTCGVVLTSGACTPTTAKEGAWVGPGDPDAATPNFDGTLVLAPIEPLVRYLESDGKPGWTFGDGLYVDVGASGTLTAGDLRIVPPGLGATAEFSCSGTTCTKARIVMAGDQDIVEANDADRTKPITLSFATGAFNLAWYDADNSGAINTSDAFFLKGPSAPTATGANTIHPDLGDVRVMQTTVNLLSSSLDYGTVVTTATGVDAKPTYRQVAPGVAITNTADANLANQHMFLHFPDPDGTNAVLLQGDVTLYRGPSGSSGGVLVTTKGTSATSPGHGTGIDTYTASFAGQLRYYDQSPAGFSANDPIYLKRAGNVAATVEIGDVRITTALPAFAAGTQAKAGDSDLGLALVTDAALVVKRFDADNSDVTPLRAMASTLLSDGLGAVAGRWEPGTEALYTGSGATVVNGMMRLFHPSLADGPAQPVVCPGDADCGTALTAYAKIRVTGVDTTYDAGSSEYIYDSENDRVDFGDVRVIDHPVGGVAGTSVVNTDADATGINLATGDIVAVSYDPLCPAACFPFLAVGDAYLYGSTFGARVTPATTGFVPVLRELAGSFTLVRFNRGDSGSAADDSFFASFAGALPLQVNDIRLTASGASAAGTLIKTGDTSYSQEVTGGAAFTRDSASLRTRLCYIDVDGRTGLSSTDPVYIEVDTVDFGAPFGATGTIQSFDLRATPYPATGTALHGAGTILLAGNSDLTSGQTTCATPGGGLTWFIRYFDANGNQRFDGADATQANDDVAYLVLGTTKDYAPPPVNAVRVSGTGGATGSTSGGGAPPPVAPPPPPPPTTSTDTSTSTTGSDTATTDSGTTSTSGTGPAAGDLAAINAALRASIQATPEGNDVIVSWQQQPGVAGYQVWRMSSPWVKLLDVSPSTKAFRDINPPAGSQYLVTAYTSMDAAGGYIEDLNSQYVPGYASIPTSGIPGNNTPASGKGLIPGFEVVALVGAVAVALVAVRRRLR
ncbi:MAG: hypothetical protein QOD77_1466 [Thermoplasmata archaeon]|jgi:hypothetical protein|nr:hypothetical protein [Thermoplasmata archaeon]